MRLAIRGDEDDVRSPPRLSAHFVDGPPTSAAIPPGGSKTVVIAWTPDREARVRQALGHVVVTSSDERAGETAMGFRAQLPTTLGIFGEHVLTFLIVGPMVVILLVGAAWLTGRGDAPMVRYASLVVGAGNLALAVWLHHFFSSDVGRGDGGNEGYQFVERAVWVRSLGAEWYVGVDGTTLPFVLLAAVTGFVAILLANAERRGAAYHAALALLTSGIVGALVALDLVVLFAAWQVVWLGLLLLVGRWGGNRRPRAAAKVAIAALVGNTALLLSFVALSRASGPSFLSGGDWVAHTLAIPELGRTSFASQPAILGLPFVGAVWLLLFVAGGDRRPRRPVPRVAAPDALEQAPPSASCRDRGRRGEPRAVHAGLHLGHAVALPEGRAVGGRVAGDAGRARRRVGGAVRDGAAQPASLRGIHDDRELRDLPLRNRRASRPRIAGSLFGTFAHGLSVVLVLGFATALEERLHTCDATRIHEAHRRGAGALRSGRSGARGVAGRAGASPASGRCS